MQHARPFEFNTFGEPIYLPQESPLWQSNDVDLWDGDVKPEGLRGGVLRVTSDRVLWHCPARTQRHAWHLSSISDMSEEAAGAFLGFKTSSPKVTLRFAGEGKCLKLSFKGEGHKETLRALREAKEGLHKREQLEAQAKLAQQQKDEEERAKKRRKDEDLGPPPAPVSTLQTMIADKRAEEQRKVLVARTFSGGLEELVKSFKELQDIINACLKTRAPKAGPAAAPAAAAAAAGGGGGSTAPPLVQADEDALIGSLLREMGSVINPVTREMASDRDFAPALARQVAGFILPHVEAAGGLMSLTDVFCLYNRARGVATVSPEDLLEAVAAMQKLQLGLTPRTLAGGLRVLALSSLTDDAMVERAMGALRACAAAGQAYVTPQYLVAHHKLPLSLARQVLDLAAARGALALDASVAGRRYYANLFLPSKVAGR
jgi:hypothetical protein